MIVRSHLTKCFHKHRWAGTHTLDAMILGAQATEVSAMGPSHEETLLLSVWRNRAAQYEHQAVNRRAQYGLGNCKWAGSESEERFRYYPII